MSLIKNAEVGKKAWLSTHKLLDEQTGEHDLRDFLFVFIELRKFKKKINELETLIEKWAYCFKHAQEATLVEMENLTGDDKIIKRAFQAIDQAGWSEQELFTYDQMVKRELDNLAVDQQKIEDAKNQGIEKGRAEGIEQIVINMLKQKVDEELIIQFTGLPKDTITRLKNQL